jgi:hypothetical protein
MVKVRRAYCSATDRNVPVMVRKDAGLGRRPSVQDSRVLVCLDYGVRCTGAFCPLFSFPSDAQGRSTRPADEARSGSR